MEAKRGDRIVVESEAVGQPTREGELLEVIAGTVSVRYRVRWSDGHESMFTPSVGSARIVASSRSASKPSGTKPAGATKTRSSAKPGTSKGSTPKAKKSRSG